MNFTVFYEVSGERIIKGDDNKVITKKPSSTRLATLFINDAQQFATDVYKREGIVLDIHEWPISPQPPQRQRKVRHAAASAT